MNIQATIESKLTQHFKPYYLQVVNESHMHSVPKDSETHFKVTLVCDQFAQLSKVKRHQQVYKILAQELAAEVHALALHLYSASEWQVRGQASPDSPQCKGASQRDPAS
jgi:BolA family transcriptional regulator, general stress-responsive regulator